MSFFSDVKSDDSIVEDRDSVGGGGAVDSGIYKHTVVMAYAVLAGSGAKGLTVHLKDEQDREVRQTFYITSGNAKGGNNFYIDKNSGEKRYLPGYTAANSLCLLTVGKEIADLEPEEKVIGKWSSEAGKEVPTKVPVLVDLLGKEIISGVLKVKEDKTKKNEMTNQYEPTGETRYVNDIAKFFRASDRKTVTEIKAQADEAVFIDRWEAKNKGIEVDRSSGAAGGNKGTAGAPAAAAGTKKPTTSLFA